MSGPLRVDPVRGIGMTSQRTRDRLVARLRAGGINDEQVLKAIGAVPRHLFVDEALASYAYEDKALPIGFGQTISQPYVVARMTAALFGDIPLRRVLEIGTGSGYQAALLDTLGVAVYTVERIRALERRARDRFRTLKLANIRLRHDDGLHGWAAHAPFDGILGTARYDEVPAGLLAQLAPGGRLVMPVGAEDRQVLCLVVRRDAGFEYHMLDQVRFVPMIQGCV